MSREEHFQYLKMSTNRNGWLSFNSLEDDGWLKNQNISIQFGDGIKGTVEKCRMIRIMLSDIYKMAADLKAKAEKSLDGIDEKFVKEIAGRDLIRTDILLLHLMRIFYYLNDGTDKQQLGEIVTHIENDLGVTSKIQVVEESKGTPIKGLSSIFNLAIDLMKKMGVEPPTGVKQPTEEELGSVLSNVFGDKSTQSAIQTLFSGLQNNGGGDLSDIVKGVVKNVSDPSTMATINETIQKTAKEAYELGKSVEEKNAAGAGASSVEEKKAE